MKLRKGKSNRQSALDAFSELDKNELLEMEYMLNQGEKNYTDIAYIIHTEWGKMKNLATNSIRQYLTKYNKYVLQPKLVTQVEDMNVYKELLSMKDKVDVLKEFTLLVLHQKARVARFIAMERQGELKINKEIRKEIKVLGGLIEKLTKTQLETGHLKRVPRFLSGEISKNDRDDPTKIEFKIKEDFLENMEVFESEFDEFIDLEAIEDHSEESEDD